MENVHAEAGLFIAGETVFPGDTEALLSPYDGALVAQVHQGTIALLDRAIGAAHDAAPTMAAMAAFERARLLERLAELLQRDKEEFSRILCSEVGKPIREARAEVDRAVQTALASAVAARQLRGEVIPLDAAPAGAGRLAFTVREPRGVIGIITPFNYPLNLAMHKLGPALAAGNAVVHKPSEQTPLSALRLGGLLKEAGVPDGAYNVVPGRGETIGAHLVASPGVDMITFTGSVEVGRWIRANAGLKPVTLELGGNSAVIVDADADLDSAVHRIVQGGYGNNGQSCISVQRVYAHGEIATQLADRVAAAVRALRIGNPRREDTEVSCLIDEGAAKRVEDVIRSAGGRRLFGGERSGRATIAPSLLVDVPETSSFMQDELFGPAIAINAYDDVFDAVARVNGTRYGLQAGVYTRDIERAFRVARELKAGGVMINDVPTFRADHMPYGGVKESGLGREGPSYAVYEMTESKLIAWKV